MPQRNMKLPTLKRRYITPFTIMFDSQIELPNVFYFWRAIQIWVSKCMEV